MAPALAVRSAGSHTRAGANESEYRWLGPGQGGRASFLIGGAVLGLGVLREPSGARERSSRGKIAP